MEQIIKFPCLNLEIIVNRVAFNIFGISIYWYAIIIVLSMALAMLIYKKQDGLYGIKFQDIIDIAMYTIPASLICARLYYILFNLDYYTANPAQVLNTRSGGMAIYGGIIGGAIMCAIFCKIRKINLLNFLDYIVPALALGQAIGRWGNFINVEAYGVETTLPWRMGIYEMGKYQEVHPTFLYESLACLIIFIVLLFLKNQRKFNGQIVCTYLLLYSFERIFVERLRTDSLMIGNIRVSQLLSILIFIASLIVYIINIFKTKKCHKSVENSNKGEET